MTTATTTAMSVSGTRLIKVLRDAFTKPNTYVAELIQNARRSGATQIKITLDSNKLFIIEDDGCGISDFNTLLAVGASGWELETIEAENAFGVGLLSAVHAAKHIRIESTSGTIESDTDALMALNDIEVTAPVRTKGTRIVLTDLQAPLQDTHVIEKLSFYSVPVFINGVEVDRTLSQDRFIANEQYASYESDLGVLYAPREECIIATVSVLQGFSVNTSSSTYHSHSGNAYLFITDTNVRARCPDRDEVLCKDAFNKRLAEQVRRHHKALFQQMATEGLFEQLYKVSEYLKDVGMLDLLNQADFLPANFLTDPASEYTLQMGYSSWTRESSPSHSVTEKEIREGLAKLVLCPQLEDVRGDEEIHPQIHRAGMYLSACKALIIDRDLDPNHWAMKAATEVNIFEPKSWELRYDKDCNPDEKLIETIKVIEANILKRCDLPSSSDCYQYLGTLNEMKFDGPLGLATLTSGTVAHPDNVTMCGIDYCPPAYEVANYNFDDRWDESAEDHDNDLLRSAFSALLTSDPAKFLQDQLCDHLQTLKSLGGGSFLVQITAKGIKVKAVQAKPAKAKAAKSKAKAKKS